MTGTVFQVSAKTDGGAIFVIGGYTYDEFVGNLQAGLGFGPAAEVLEAMTKALTKPEPVFPAPGNVGQAYPAQSHGAGFGAQQPDPAPWNNNRAPAGPAPGSGVKSCNHGPMTFRSGTNNRGAWQGYFCPLPQSRKAEQCPAEFIR